MICMKCQKHFSECTCSDLEERLNKAVKGGHFVYRYCKLCDKYYERCKCLNPVWGIKGAENDEVVN